MNTRRQKDAVAYRVSVPDTKPSNEYAATENSVRRRPNPSKFGGVWNLVVEKGNGFIHPPNRGDKILTSFPSDQSPLQCFFAVIFNVLTYFFCERTLS